jgi:hypothetical protein
MKRFLIPIALTAVLLLTGCGGGSEPEPTVQPTPIKTQPTATPGPGGSDWPYRLQGYISPSAECSNLSDYQVMLTVHYGAGANNGGDVYLNGSAQDDFDDIRFTAGDGVTLLDYWVEDYTKGANATVWIKFDDIPEEGTALYLYYGNPAAKSDSDGYATFVIFNDGSSIFGWKQYAGAGGFDWSVVEGTIRCVSTGNVGFDNLYYNSYLDTLSYVMESRIRAQDGGNVSDNYQQGIGCSYNNPIARWLESDNCWQLRDPHNATNSAPDATFNAAKWHDYTFIRNNDIWKLIVDGDLKIVHNAEYSNPCAGMYVFTQLGGHWVEFDDFRVRNYCEPEPIWGPWSAEANEPTVEATPEETSPSTATPTLEATPTPEATQTTEPTSTIPPITTPQP